MKIKTLHTKGLWLTLVLACLVTIRGFSQKQATYDGLWKKVDSLDSKRLPKDAYKVVNNIYAQAKKTNNASQLVKATVYKLRYIGAVKENSLIKSLEALRMEAASAQYPVKPLLHSMLAQIYWQFYQVNRYRFLNRSTTVNAKQDDISTWDLHKVVHETIRQYKLSLANPQKLQQTKIDIYDDVLHKGRKKQRQHRPTLYDFLAHRAINFFQSSEPNITRPAYQFTLNKTTYLQGVEQFAQLNIASQDTMSYKYYMVTILQDLIKFHLKDKNYPALVDVDLKRLAFVYQHLTTSNKEELYKQALRQLEQKSLKYPISSEVTHTIAQLIYTQGTQYNPRRSGKNKWKMKEALKIAQTGIDRFPKSDGAVLCQNLQKTIRGKSIGITIEEANLSNAPFRALVSFRNVNKVYWRFVKTSMKEIVKVKRKRSYHEDILKHYIAKSPLKTSETSLPNDQDYQTHYAEEKLNGLPHGTYVAIASAKPDFSIGGNGLAYAYFTVSDIAWVHRNVRREGATEFYVLHRKTGEPLAGVKAQVWLTYYNYQKSRYTKVNGGVYMSNKEGYIKVPYKSNKRNQRNFYVEFNQGTDKIYTLSPKTYSSRYGNLYRTIARKPRTRTRVFFYLDRKIYRPGQTVYFKGVVLNTDGESHKLLTKQASSVTLYDVNRQKVATLNVTTNEYGTFSGSFMAPNTGLNGQMHIASSLGRRYQNSVYFSVEDYKRPKFEVKFTPVKGSFKLNETITTKAKAKAYSGANIDGAKVKYRVVRKARFPYWFYYWYGYYPSSPQMEIGNGVAKTDENGEFEVKFKAIPDLSVSPQSDPIFTYTVYADVTDLNGETRSGNLSVGVGYRALELAVSVPSKVNKTGENEWKINSTNLSGTFEPAQGNIVIHRLQTPDKTYRKRRWGQPDKYLYSIAEWQKMFPDDLYKDENNRYRWKKQSEVYNAKFDTQKSKALTVANIKSWKPGYYMLEIKAKDKFGKEVKSVKYFEVFDPKSKTLATNAISYLTTLKGTAEPGETAQFLVGTALPKAQILYEIEHQGKIIKKEWLTLKKRQRILEIPIVEAYRGNLAFNFVFVYNNRLYNRSQLVYVPRTNKALDISFETFRNKLNPGQKEEWRLKIKGKKGDKVAAEMVATLYDASLDVFRSNSFDFGIYRNYYATLRWNSSNVFNTTRFNNYSSGWNPSQQSVNKRYDRFNWFGFSFSSYYYRYFGRRPGGNLYADYESEKGEEVLDDMAKKSSVKTRRKRSKNDKLAGQVVANKPQLQQKGGKQAKKEDLGTVKARTNFNETAFFYPQLRTNEKGEVIIKFTIPEALTKWKMLGFAHTQDLKYGMISNTLVTQKELMVVPNAPRFFRENDQMTFSSKVTNITDKAMKGSAQLFLFDAITNQPIDAKMGNTKAQQSFKLAKGRSTALSWNIKIPEGTQAITYRVVAKSGKFADGEEMTLPVLSNRMLVTETMPLPVRSGQTKTFTFAKLKASAGSKTLRHHKVTLEFTSNPAWYAIQSLPYLMEFPYECAEQTFSRFYANSIASHIANSSPNIKKVFDSWKNITPDALLSNLEKNQELKSLVLRETPWVLNSKSESERKRRVGVLFDLNRMSNELQRALNKLVKKQVSNGAWPWFDGGPEDRYITQHVVTGMGHLDHLGVKNVRKDKRAWNMTRKAVGYLDRKINEDYRELLRLAKRGKLKMSDDHLWYLQIQYLYARSYFKDLPIPAHTKEAFAYYQGQAKKYWTNKNKYMWGMIALGLHRYDDKTTPQNIVKSLRQYAIKSEEMGMYWRETGGYYWYQAPIEKQALMIEVFDEVAKDQKAVDDLRTFLLKSKQTQDWKTTKATSEACYALLLKGTQWLAETKMAEITMGGQKIDPLSENSLSKVEAGTGYFKMSWNAEKVTPAMAEVTVKNPNPMVAWGSVYWQYFEQLDKITPAKTPLQLKKQLFLQKNSDAGPVITPIGKRTKLQVGDLIKVRIELKVDRLMEYVHMKDMRASGLEPLNTISRYKWQDGLGYYESTRDAATHFFFGALPKGSYVFEYPLRVTHAGNFSNGITSIQCMYAPEFASHSEGIRVKVAKK
ncbi:alpha-2-macroglobulin family protein [uncultured Microscilla sp.]|uniref:alpha-2-macroglobulin family protein n=1 Tax=uncultured Microscilla sp. TaxID=432653 RepID=UPI002610AFF1|nr:alpha-2-macroglobulin family protein [uncultured Microscilla sp.]